MIPDCLRDTLKEVFKKDIVNLILVDKDDIRWKKSCRKIRNLHFLLVVFFLVLSGLGYFGIIDTKGSKSDFVFSFCAMAVFVMVLALMSFYGVYVEKSNYESVQNVVKRCTGVFFVLTILGVANTSGDNRFFFIALGGICFAKALHLYLVNTIVNEMLLSGEWEKEDWLADAYKETKIPHKKF